MEEKIKYLNSLDSNKFFELNNEEKQRRNVKKENFVLTINNTYSGIPNSNYDQKVRAFIKAYSRLNSPPKINYKKIQDSFFLKRFNFNLDI